ncbi:MAG: hypothetical protein DYG93_05935 [Leptolyngbya sp. PLA2]|nr:hypothetical protein [Leptolyngbya sp.]MCE7971189.1 hypothetical protein [Leptolyngbya sp. PL-A2]MCQ3940868.1 hypothetical protein [cyanobacterium CYA1]MCZ7634110.1 hypothetical protein [Phycisphaerales bacterium]MDL1905182.1 hypothetical protein [Synechococcales cyanobacterium CNB]GIK19268.1 MAG: hypothetical protein BroJett004_14320 [Planctomycetota bacterium]
MHFFIDRNVPEQLARMLGYYDRNHTVIYHDDRFEKTTADTEWLKLIAGWDPVPVVISGDGRILKNPAELQVLRDLPLTFFLFAGAWFNLRWSEFAWKAIKVWPEVVSAAAPPRPSIYRIPVSAQKVEFMAFTHNLGASRRRA